MALNSEKINFHEFVHIDNLAWTNGTSIEEEQIVDGAYSKHD
jgi:hypothetical protein